LVYVLESDDTRLLEVGKDYEVKKIGKDRVTLLVPGKKKPVSIDFGVKSVSVESEVMSQRVKICSSARAAQSLQE